MFPENTDKYITLEHLILFGKFFEAKGRASNKLTISGIERKGNEYLISFQDNGGGFTDLFRVEGNNIVFVDRVTTWMS